MEGDLERVRRPLEAGGDATVESVVDASGR